MSALDCWGAELRQLIFSLVIIHETLHAKQLLGPMQEEQRESPHLPENLSR